MPQSLRSPDHPVDDLQQGLTPLNEPPRSLFQRLLGFLRLRPHSKHARKSEMEIVDLLFGLARRHDEVFSVILAETQPSQALGGTSKKAFYRTVDRVVRGAVRRSDRVVGDGDGRCVIYCPRTGNIGALHITERVRKAMNVVSGSLTVTGHACFPEDALTLEELVRCASNDIEKQRRGYDGSGDGDSGLSSSGSFTSVDKASSRSGALTRKRAYDLLLLIVGAPLYLPLIGLITVAELCSNPAAPIFFHQFRTGRGGRRFRMLKFRTMVQGADEMKQDLAHLNELSWPDFKIANDPRITRLGRILRRTSLDELPQLFNVLRGEMSLVGPRPTSFKADRYRLWHTERLDATPGMTGLWQVEGRSVMEFDDRLRLDIAYIRNRRPWTDTLLLLRTIRTVTAGLGAR